MSIYKKLARNIMSVYYHTPQTPQILIKHSDDKKKIAAIIREIVNELQYYNTEGPDDMIIDARDLYNLADFIEKYD